MTRRYTNIQSNYKRKIVFDAEKFLQHFFTKTNPAMYIISLTLFVTCNNKYESKMNSRIRAFIV